MSFTAKEKSDYKPIPEGNHRAVCSALIDLGMQDAFGTFKPQLLLRFEFPDHRVDRVKDGEQASEPMVKWQFYTNSLNSKANLRRDLEGWRDKGFTKEELEGFDVRNVLEHPCRISIIHDHSGDRVKDKIRTISKLLGEGAKPLPELEVLCYSKETGEIEQWDLLPQFVKDKVSAQLEVEATPDAPADEEPFADDDVPF